MGDVSGQPLLELGANNNPGHAASHLLVVAVAKSYLAEVTSSGIDVQPHRATISTWTALWTHFTFKKYFLKNAEFLKKFLKN